MILSPLTAISQLIIPVFCRYISDYIRYLKRLVTLGCVSYFESPF